MSKRILLVGHCGPDSSYLRMAVKKSLGDVEILSADDSNELSSALRDQPIDLVLFNRELGYGFDPESGVEAIRTLAGKSTAKLMLVSNFPDAQQAALQAGALPGFGKRELGTPRVTQLLRAAVGETVAQ